MGVCTVYTLIDTGSIDETIETYDILEKIRKGDPGLVTKTLVEGTTKPLAKLVLKGAKTPVGAKTALVFELALLDPVVEYFVAPPPGRPLTASEIKEARKVYGNSIHYPSVRVIDAKFAGAPGIVWGNNIYLSSADPRFSNRVSTDYEYMGTLIHELGHVRQYQHGEPYRIVNGLEYYTMGRNTPYTFSQSDLDAIRNKTRDFKDFRYEQQAEIARMYWQLNKFQISTYMKYVNVDKAVDMPIGSKNSSCQWYAPGVHWEAAHLQHLIDQIPKR